MVNSIEDNSSTLEQSESELKQHSIHHDEFKETNPLKNHLQSRLY